METEKSFDKDTLLEALNKLGELAFSKKRTIEIAIYGGSALMLTFDWRVSTKDVDAVYEKDKSIINDLSKIVSEEFSLPEDWLNDGVKGFLSRADMKDEAKVFLGDFPSEDRPGIKVFLASPPYLFAMKCMALRFDNEENSDINDIIMLAKELNIETADMAFEVVEKYYPTDRLPARNQFGIQELFDNLEKPMKLK